MHPIITARRLLLSGLAAFVGGTAAAQPPEAKNPPAAANAPVAKAPDVKVGKGGELIVPLGGTVRFVPNLPKPFKDVLTANDTIVQVKVDPNDPKAVQLVGLAPGLTRLTFTLIDDTKGEYEVVVQPDYDLLRKVIQKAVPTASIDVIPGVGTSIILGGYVNKPEDAETVMKIAGAAGGGGGGAAGAAAGAGNIINAIQVGGLQHVQIEVVFASVDRTKLRQRGADFIINGTTGSFSSTVSGLITPGTAGSASTVGTAANIVAGITPAGLLIALQALKGESIAKFLTEPKIVTQSGRPAIIRSGGQQAVLSASSGGLGSISVSLEQIGTTMSVLPIVYGNGKIYLEVAPSIRQVNSGNGIQTSAGFSPGFTEQSASASVMLESGQTFAIGGLLETSVQSNVSKVPVIGEIPYVGSLFSTASYTERESELIILITPRLVDALDCTQTPKRVPGLESRTPDDYEFYLEGLLEAPRGQRQVWNGRCYNAAYKCDPTYGIFPAKGNVCGAGGSCNTGANAPTSLPAANRPAPALAAPMPPAPMPAPAPAPAASLPTAAPTADPIVMPQTGLVTPPAELPKAPVETVPAAPAATPPLVTIPEVLPEANAVPGPVAPSEVPAPAPLAPSEK